MGRVGAGFRGTAILGEMPESAFHRDLNCTPAREGPLGEGGPGWVGAGWQEYGDFWEMCIHLLWASWGNRVQANAEKHKDNEWFCFLRASWNELVVACFGLARLGKAPAGVAECGDGRRRWRW